VVAYTRKLLKQRQATLLAMCDGLFLCCVLDFGGVALVASAHTITIGSRSGPSMNSERRQALARAFGAEHHVLLSAPRGAGASAWFLAAIRPQLDGFNQIARGKPRRRAC